jgi:hypothetical protein
MDSVDDLDDKLKSWQSKFRRLRHQLRGGQRMLVGQTRNRKRSCLINLTCWIKGESRFVICAKNRFKRMLA